MFVPSIFARELLKLAHLATLSVSQVSTPPISLGKCPDSTLSGHATSGRWILASGRVRVCRGGLRTGLSVPAPFVWRCLTSRTITPFPHPSHRTGHAELPHPALGQDACLRPRKVSCRPPAHRTGPCCPGGQRPDELQTTASVAPWASIRSPDRNPSSLFASACGAFRSCRTLQEFPRVTPISRASPLSAPVLNGGPFPPPALPGFPGSTGLSATPARPL